MSFKYFEVIRNLIDEIETNEKTNINKLVDKMYETIKSKSSIFAFGSAHAGILTQELFYRAGGLVLINPIFARDLLVDTVPISATSKLERLEGFGNVLVDISSISKGDLVILHSVSGRNSVIIDFAIEAKARGAYIVGITNVEYSKQVSSRHSSKTNLYQIADLVIDNHGTFGDASVELPNTSQKVAPTSTISAILILNTVVSEVCIKLANENPDLLPIFYSANIDGNDELNEQVFKRYADQIHYEL